MIDLRGQWAAHLGDAALRDPAVDRHLPQPQVGMHQTEAEGGVVIGLGDDVGDLMLIPMDRHWLLQWQPLRRHGLQPIVHGGGGRERLQQGATADQSADRQR